jgi:hypothetical protein
MINLLFLLIISLAPKTTAVDFALQQEIPALEADAVKSILLFEIEGLQDTDVVVENIKLLGDKAKATVMIRGERKTVSLICRKGDFGPVWELEGSVEESLVQVEGEPATATEAESAPARETAPEGEPEVRPAMVTRDAMEYQAFLTDFVTTLRDGREADFEDFYYKESDFDMARVEGTPEEARAKFAAERGFFLKACSEVSGLLRNYRSFEVISVVATGVPARVKRRLSTWVPALVDFYSSAYIEVELDGNRGMISIDGIAGLEDGWRVGAIADYQLPIPQPEPQQQ